MSNILVTQMRQT